MKALTTILLTLLMSMGAWADSTNIGGDEDKNYIFNTPPQFADTESGIGAFCVGEDNESDDRLDVYNQFQYLKIHKEINPKYSEELAASAFIYVSTYDRILGWKKLDAMVTGNGLLFFEDTFANNKRLLRCILSLEKSLEGLMRICSAKFDKSGPQILTLPERLQDIEHYVRSKTLYNCTPEPHSALDGHAEFLKKQDGDQWDKYKEGMRDLGEESNQESSKDLEEFDEALGCKPKSFIDNWETICPGDWSPFPSNTELQGSFLAPRSIVKEPTDIMEETGRIEFAYQWISHYNSEGFMGEGDPVKAMHIRYYAQCHKERYGILERHLFADINAKTKIHTIIDSPIKNWFPITKDTDIQVILLCEREDLYDEKIFGN